MFKRIFKNYMFNLGEKRDVVGALQFLAGTYLGIVFIAMVISIIVTAATGTTDESIVSLVAVVVKYINIIFVSLIGLTIMKKKRLNYIYLLTIVSSIVLLYFYDLAIGLIPVVYLTTLSKKNN